MLLSNNQGIHNTVGMDTNKPTVLAAVLGSGSSELPTVAGSQSSSGSIVTGTAISAISSSTITGTTSATINSINSIVSSVVDSAAICNTMLLPSPISDSIPVVNTSRAVSASTGPVNLVFPNTGLSPSSNTASSTVRVSASSTSSLHTITLLPATTTNTSTGGRAVADVGIGNTCSATTVLSVPIPASIASTSISTSYLPSNSQPTSASVSSLTAVCVATPAVNSLSVAPALHIPRGAAVVANMAGNRTSQAVTASAAQRSAVLPKSGIHLSPSNWSRATGSMMVSGNGSINTPIINSLANTSAPLLTSITNNKLTRLPSPSVPSRPAIAQTTSLPPRVAMPSTASTLLRPTSVTRITSAAPPSTGGVSKAGVLSPVGIGAGTPRLATPVSSGVVARTSTVITSGAVSRTLLAQTRTTTASRPPSVGPLGAPIRLTQTTTLSAQRQPTGSAPFALTTVQRPSAMTGVRARFSLASTGITPSMANAVTTTTVSPASAPPARPLSTPCSGGGTGSRAVQCTGRPASTGPALPLQQQTVRAARVPTAATLVRAEGVTVRPVAARQHHFLHMQKVPLSLSSTNCPVSSTVSIVCAGSGSRSGPFSSNTSSALSPTSPSIAVRITSSSTAAVALHNTTSQASPTASCTEVNLVATGRPAVRQADMHTTLLTGVSPSATAVLSGTKVLSSVLTGSSAAAASAAAAVLPPGTTITPAVLSPPHTQPHHDVSHSVLVQRATAGVGGGSVSAHYTITSQPTQQFFVEKPSAITVGGSSLRGNPGVGGCGRRAVSGQGSSTEASQQQGGAPPVKSVASPRPSILRKRSDYESVSNSKACKNLSGALSSSSSSSPPSPKRPDSRGNSGTSTGSATLSADSSPGLLIEECESNEDPRSASLPLSPAVPPPPPLPDGISPRKKPRKQQLTGNELQEAHHSSDAEEDRVSQPPKRAKRELECQEDVQGWCAVSPSGRHCRGGRAQYQQGLGHTHDPAPHRTTSGKAAHGERPSTGAASHPAASPVRSASPNQRNGYKNRTSANTMRDNDNNNNNNNIRSSSNHNLQSGSLDDNAVDFNLVANNKMQLYVEYQHEWTQTCHHFEKYEDVNVKSEKRNISVRPTETEKLVLQKLEGWKVVHVGGQVAELVDVEKEVSARLNDILGTLELRTAVTEQVCNKDLDQICELIKANVQRSKIIHDQMLEARSQMSKLFSHKERIAQIMSKFSSKRQLRKKEKR